MRLSIIIILNSLEDIHPDVTVKTSYFSIQLQRVGGGDGFNFTVL